MALVGTTQDLRLVGTILAKTPGPTGPRGATGYQGSTGIQGDTGIQGLTGPDGVGFTGLQGIQGDTGIQGLTGPAGLGTTGLIGATGLPGPTGAIGPQGATGLRGVTGVQGIQGATGVQGITGVGVDGATGIQGIQGVTGLGLQGATGTQGIAGAAGATGVQGVTGLIGNTGIGSAGAAGATGVQGVTGLVGNTGVVGTTGVSALATPVTYAIMDDLTSVLALGSIASAGQFGWGNGAVSVYGTHTAGSASTIIATVANHPGIWRATVGTTANVNLFLGYARASSGATANLNRVEANTPWIFEACMAVSSNATGVGSLWLGVMSAQPAANTTQSGTTTGAYFELLDAVGYGTAIPYGFNSTTYTGTTTNSIFGSGTTYQTFRITYDGTTLAFFLNGVAKGSTATATDIITGACSPGIFHRSGGTSIILDMDYVFWQYTGTR